jgi:hypothetical protein
MKSLSLLVVALFVMVCVGCGTNNLEFVKANAKAKWASVGYEVIGYEGYQWGFQFGAYGGAHVWHTLQRNNNGIIYTGYLQRWGEEIHVYGPHAVDAIKPGRN